MGCLWYIPHDTSSISRAWHLELYSSLAISTPLLSSASISFWCLRQNEARQILERFDFHIDKGWEVDEISMEQASATAKVHILSEKSGMRSISCYRVCRTSNGSQVGRRKEVHAFCCIALLNRSRCACWNGRAHRYLLHVVIRAALGSSYVVFVGVGFFLQLDEGKTVKYCGQARMQCMVGLSVGQTECITLGCSSGRIPVSPDSTCAPRLEKGIL